MLDTSSTSNDWIRALGDVGEEFNHMIRFFPGEKGVLEGNRTCIDLEGDGTEWSATMIADGLNYLLDYEKHSNVKTFYHLWDEEKIKAEPNARYTGMAAFLLPKKAKCVFICAGGGYEIVANLQEGYPVAKAINEMGYHAFVVQYRVGNQIPGENAEDSKVLPKGLMPAPLEDLAQAVRIAMSHEEEWQLDLKDYAVMGFSAGAHLAGSFALKSIGYGKYGLPRPGAVFLGYPATLIDAELLPSMRQFMFGEDWDKEEVYSQYSVEKLITEDYPKAFFWQCEEDRVVSFQSSQLLEKALKEHNIPYIYETYPGNWHGWGLADGRPADGWLRRAVAFWQA